MYLIGSSLHVQVLLWLHPSQAHSYPQLFSITQLNQTCFLLCHTFIVQNFNCLRHFNPMDCQAPRTKKFKLQHGSENLDIGFTSNSVSNDDSSPSHWSPCFSFIRVFIEGVNFRYFCWSWDNYCVQLFSRLRNCNYYFTLVRLPPRLSFIIYTGFP